MARPPQFSADFRPWRAVCVVFGAGLIAMGFRFLYSAAQMGGLAAAGPAIFGMACFVCAAMFVSPSLVGLVARPITGWAGDLFYPTETFRQPPETLLRSLRMQLRDRYWGSVDQQTRELINAYGPSPELYHLRAVMEGGRSGSHSAITVEASQKLSRRAFDRYVDLVHRDPPPAAVQSGIEA